MSQRKTTANKFELVVVAGARAKQLLRGCTPRTTGSDKLVKLAVKEASEGKVERIALED